MAGNRYFLANSPISRAFVMSSGLESTKSASAPSCDMKALPQIQAIKAPSPYNVMFQRKRDLVAQIKAGLPGYLKVGCAALLKDEETIFVQTLGPIGIPIAAGAMT